MAIVSVTFLIQDETSKAPISGASIQIGLLVLTTGSDGTASTSFESGITLSYTVTAEGYVTKSGTYITPTWASTVTVNLTRTAAPGPKTWTLQIAVSGKGSTTPSPGSYTVAQGSSHVLSAIPALGWKFDDWLKNGSAMATTPNITVKVESDVVYTAVFKERALPRPVSTTAKVTVTVYEGTVDVPVEAAKLEVDGLIAYTDSTGVTTIEEIEPGDYTLTVSKAPYDPQSFEISLKAGDEYTQQVIFAAPPASDWDPLTSWLSGIWDLMLGAVSVFASSVSAGIEGAVLGLADTLTEAVMPGSPDEKVKARVRRLIINYRDLLEERARKIIKKSPDLDQAYAQAQTLQTQLLAADLSLEIGGLVADQIQPLRELGIHQMARTLASTMGVQSMLQRLLTMPVEIGVFQPLEYYYNRLYTPRIPGLGDLITMLVREVITLDQYIQYAAWQGESEGWAQKRWAAHWRTVAPEMATDAFHRGAISLAQWESLIVRNDYNPEPWKEGFKSDLDLVRGLRKELIPRVDIRRGWEYGLISDEGLQSRYVGLGYEEDALLEAEIQKREALDSERGAVARAAGRIFRETIKAATKAFAEGTITEDVKNKAIYAAREDFRTELTELQYREMIQALWIRRYELEAKGPTVTWEEID